MKRLMLVLSAMFLLISHNSNAQNETDALRYSMVGPGGTARSVGMGGAFGALGGDFTSLSINPAGIGIYRKSEFTITPGFSLGKVASSYYGTSEEDFKYNVNLSNLGFVLAFNTPGQSTEPGWRGFQIGFGVNQLANFNNRKVYEGDNYESSFLTQMLNEAFDVGNPDQFDPFTTALAFGTYLIDTMGGEFYFDEYLDAGNVIQRGEFNNSGSVREMVLSFGANYNDRFYMGATLGFTRVRFEQNLIYREEDNIYFDVNANDWLNNPYFDYMEFTDNLTTTGNGFNLKLGAIYRASDMIRLGAAVHTPTFYNLKDHNQTKLEVRHWPVLMAGMDVDQAKSDIRLFNYELNTPMRLIGSLGLIFGTNGLLSFDYEYADFTQMRMRSNIYSFTQENRSINNNFTAQHNLRAGGEIRLNPIILRAGYAISTSPYAQRDGEILPTERINDNDYAVKSTISAGIGLREQNFFIDFGYYLSRYSEDYYPYSSNLTLPVNFDYRRSGFLMTVGLRF
jgi:hypothetical protein